MKKTAYPLDRVHCLLEPGPVLIVSTAYARRRKLMCLSWHTMLEFEPPLLGCVLSRGNDSFVLLDASGECVLNIPTVELLDAVVGVGNSHGQAVDKFPASGLTAAPASVVGAPLVEECFANLECRGVDRDLVPRDEMFVLEVVAAWHDPKVRQPRTLHHRGWGEFMVAGESLQSASKMH